MIGALRRPLDIARARLADRADSEHEQALVRVAILSVFFVYLLPEALQGGAGA